MYVNCNRLYVLLIATNQLSIFASLWHEASTGLPKRVFDDVDCFGQRVSPDVVGRAWPTLISRAPRYASENSMRF